MGAGRHPCGALVYTSYVTAVVVVVMFLQLVLYCLLHLSISYKGGTTPFFFFSSFFRFPCFLHFIECVCRACRIQYDDMTLHSLFCLLHNNVLGTWYTTAVVSLWRSSFTTHRTCICLGLKNRHGRHWLCWMSTSRKSDTHSSKYKICTGVPATWYPWSSSTRTSMRV